MGVLEKIKNALFEVEYVEVEDKKDKKKEKEPVDEPVETEKPIAKKIVLPGKKEEKVQEIQEEELKDEDFEIRPKDEKVKEVFQDNFNVMDDDPPMDQPKEEFVEPVVENTAVDITPLVEPIAAEPAPAYQAPVYAEKDYVREYDSSREKVHNTINTIYDDYRIKTRESKPYGMDPSYQVSIKEYGRENRDEKGTFKPSPIISPIYGILDKNYRKEDVVSKKEIRLTSSYAKANMNVDDIRDKAYGVKEEIPVVAEPPKTRPPFLEPQETDENLLVDLTDEKKPEVKEITVGDAMEYYHDLGLEYNVDYVDASNKNPQQPADDLEEDIKDTMDSSAPVVEEPVIERTMDIPVQEIASKPEEKKEETVEEKKEEVVEKPTKESTVDDDDNLFDLIDSMYKEEDN